MVSFEEDRLGNSHGSRNGLDAISKLILHVLQEAAEPLETKDIEERCHSIDSAITRTRIFYRLQNLRAEGLIRGKFIGSGRGSWIWWVAGKPSRQSRKAETQIPTVKEFEQRSRQIPDEDLLDYGDISHG